MNMYISLEKTLKKIIEKYNRDDFKVVIDTANGATYEVAEKVFSKLRINHKIINNTPNGININERLWFNTFRNASKICSRKWI